MKKAIVFLANGFEEMEATGTVDILRRGGIDTKTVSITDDRKVIGAHNMEYTADATFTEIDLSDADALILPGGMPGASNLNNSEPVKEALLQQYREGSSHHSRGSKPSEQWRKKGIRTEKGEFNRWIKATNAVIQDIKKKIALLFDWIAEAKAELAKPQAPTLFLC